MALRILKGIIDPNAAGGGSDTPVNLFTYQGKDLTRAWRVSHMEVTNYSAPSVSTSTGIILHTHEVYQPRFNITDNQVISIGFYDGDGAGMQTMMKPDHTIITQLFGSNTDTQAANYIIYLEEVGVTPSENILYQMKERAQSEDF